MSIRLIAAACLGAAMSLVYFMLAGDSSRLLAVVG